MKHWAVALLFFAVVTSRVHAQLKEVALVLGCDDSITDSLLPNYKSCQKVDQTQLPGKAYFFNVDASEDGVDFDFQMSIRYTTGRLQLQLDGPEGWNATEKCGEELYKCIYIDETSALVYLDRTVLDAGKYVLKIVPASFASYSIRVETPNKNPLLVPEQVDVLKDIVTDCCPADMDSIVCAMLRKAVADDRSDNDDICHQRPNVCSGNGLLTKLVLRGRSDTDGTVQAGLKCESFPKAIAQLESLETLDLSNNLLEFGVGEMAAVTSQLPKLDRIIARNNKLNGEFSCDLVTDTMVSLWLDINTIAGKLPDCIFNAPKLQILSLAKNNLEGTIPDIPKSSPLTLLNLGRPNVGAGLTGPIPASISNMKELWGLDLSANQLTGSIPDLPKDIQNVNLTSNQLEGPLPATLMKAQYLTSFHVAQNKLGGALPTGKIATKYLATLDLSSNSFTGPLLAIDLTPVAKTLTSLDVSNNKLNGSIPPYLASMPTLVSIDLSSNAFSGELVKFAELLGEDNVMDQFIVGNNNLTGKLPQELEQLNTFNDDELTVPQVFDISNNALTGDFPLWILDHVMRGRALTLGGNQMECPGKFVTKDEQAQQLLQDFHFTCYSSRVKREILLVDAAAGRITQSEVTIKREDDPRTADGASPADATATNSSSTDPAADADGTKDESSTADGGVHVIETKTEQPASSTKAAADSATPTAPAAAQKSGMGKDDKFGIILAAVLASLVVGVIIGVATRFIRCRPRVQKEKKYNLYQDALATV